LVAQHINYYWHLVAVKLNIYECDWCSWQVMILIFILRWKSRTSLTIVSWRILHDECAVLWTYLRRYGSLFQTQEKTCCVRHRCLWIPPLFQRRHLAVPVLQLKRWLMMLPTDQLTHLLLKSQWKLVLVSLRLPISLKLATPKRKPPTCSKCGAVGHRNLASQCPMRKNEEIQCKRKLK